MPRLFGLLLLLSFLTGSVLLAQEPKQQLELTKEERAKLEAEAAQLNQEGLSFLQTANDKEAEKTLREALRLRQKLYPKVDFPDGHPDLATSLNNLAYLLETQGNFTAAEPLYRQTLAMQQQLYPPNRFPNGHPNQALNLLNLANLLQKQGQFAAAEPLYGQALAMQQKLYPPDRFPDGHPQMAACMNNLAALHKARGEPAAAEPLFRQVLTMVQKLYPASRFPDGHPHVAASLNNLAGLLKDQGRYAAAEPLYAQALVMRQKLYPAQRFPDGHPDLANNLHNLAHLYEAQGHYAAAEPLYRQALMMKSKFYPVSRFPDGHPDFAGSIHSLAVLLQTRGQFLPSEAFYRDALAMYRRLALAHAEVYDEGQVLTFLAHFPGTQNGYLALLQDAPNLGRQGYTSLWENRGFLTRLAEQKRLALRAAAVSPTVRQDWEELVSLKRQRRQALLASEPRTPERARAKEKLLEEWGRKIHALSAQMHERIPALRGLQRQNQSTPADLQPALPPEGVFVDLLRYAYYENKPVKPGKEGEKRTLRYVAFLVTRQEIHHIDLGPAAPIEEALRSWREALTNRNAPSNGEPPATLRRLLWEPLEKHFPPGTTTVYLCPDQQLCFLPWGALPGKKADTVLLEDYTLAIVPHGPYLLGQLLGTKEKEEKKTDLLVLGGVKYDDFPVQALPAVDRSNDDPKAAPVLASKGGWRYLPGTAGEAERIRKQAEQRQFKTQYLGGMEAGVERFKQELPRARIAHLATHGFFADAKFRSVFQMDEKLFAMRGQERVGAGALLPSLLSGLVFAGANRPETPGRGIVTAEELFDLDLTGMELAVLSACETGLGEVGGGEGVFGLQRAFHVAGCKNVIASLWKVNDIATMVLMEEFYRNLWEKKLFKREALRQAQLTVYRNPDLVTKRAKEMGVRGIDDEAVPVPAAGPDAPRRSPPAWWAAFLLSGLGE